MAERVRAFFDEENRVIRQEIFVAMTESDFNELVEQTGNAAQKLPDPDNIRILARDTMARKLSSKVRRKSRDLLKDPRLKKIAVLGGVGGVMKAMIIFVNLGSGTSKLKWFPDEKSALEWLRE
ncbi:MAG: hypothetical protein GF401_20620 [Chitinivibrionales bacterium]|nr:hypothetical protein [Chitinivibrionales bacterium]